MNVILLVSAIAILFVVIAVSEPIATRLRLPYTVVLAAVGALMGTGAVLLQSSALSDDFDPATLAILSLPIRSSVFMYVLLPTLLFQVALGLNLRRMLDDWVPIIVLAVVAVVVATFSVGLVLQQFSAMSLLACLLLGAIVSTTDPSAVVGIFRNIAAPQRLTRIVEGESLLNDAVAIALFGFFLTFVMAGVPNPTLNDMIVGFPTIILLGVATGWIMARLGLLAMSLIPAHPMAQMSISIALPYITYIMADRMLGASGVIAVVVTGMTLNLVGPGRLAPATWAYLREVWDLLGHWAGAFIFILAALLVPRLLADARPGHLLLIGLVVLAAVAARIAMLWGVLPLLGLLRLSPKVESPYRIAILWGGLRGAVTLALALAVTENPLVPPSVKTEVGILATGFTLFTLFVQGTTLRPLIMWLGLARLAPIDLALSNQVIAVALQNVRENVSQTLRDQEMNRDIVRSEAKRFGERLDEVVARAEAAEEIPDRDRVTLGLLALAGRERDLILENYRRQLVSSRLFEVMLADCDRLIERTRTTGRSGYRDAGRLARGYGRQHTLAVWGHNRLRISAPLGRMTADRFELLLKQRLILRELHSYIDGKIRRIHGRRVSDLLHEMLRRREDETALALDGLRLQYPGYSEEIERRYIRRIALGLEEREYDMLHGDGLIGPELHMTLRANLAQERARLDQRPKLDLAVQKSELVRRFPLFADMPEAQRRQLARRLKTLYVQPGHVLMRKGDPARDVYFIASGAVEAETAGQKYRLGPGEMFGQLSILTTRQRRAQVIAISHCTLLRLDDTRFKQLLARNTTLRRVVTETAAERGVQLTLDAAE